MSESSDIDTGPSDREGKPMKNSEVEEEEEKEKEKDVSEEQNPSVVAADTEVCDKMTLQPSAESIFESSLKKQKTRHFTEGHDQSHDDVMPELESRQQEDANKEEGDPSSTEATTTDSIPAEFGQAEFLFVARLYPINFETSTLIIPRKTAEKHILARTGTLKEVALQVSDSSNNKDEHLMILAIPPPSTSSLVILVITGWKEFLVAHNLGAEDLIRFYKPEHPRHDKHYLVNYVKAPRPAGTVDPSSAVSTKTGANSNIAESNPGTYLFMKQLAWTDIAQKLGIPRKDAGEHFSTPTIGCKEDQVLQLYDAQDVIWEMNLKLIDRHYRLHGPWESFVSRHHLVSGDLIIFYKPDHQPVPNNHFSVRCVKAETYRNDQSARPRNEPKPVSETRGPGTRLFGKDIFPGRV